MYKELTKSGKENFALLHYQLRVIVSGVLGEYVKAVGEFGGETVDLELLPAHAQNIKALRADAVAKKKNPNEHAAKLVIIKHKDSDAHPILLQSIAKVVGEIGKERGVVAEGEVIAFAELQSVAANTSKNAQKAPKNEEKVQSDSDAPADKEKAPKRQKKTKKDEA